MADIFLRGDIPRRQPTKPGNIRGDKYDWLADNENAGRAARGVWSQREECDWLADDENAEESDERRLEPRREVLEDELVISVAGD